ncbi:MAG: ABC transporter ATP-binding protein [Spirochaetes bacterium]|nr:MAG: ABC transporter ATP-binding protein [Spirochaetota bacterium]
MGNPLYIEKVIKTFGVFNAVDGISLEIEEGEFFTLLGPSGCGKTTLLRMIAGFNSVDSGVIRYKEKVLNNIPAHRRNIGMVFQNYAIFPHMSVFNNVAYGLKARKIPKDEIEKRVTEVLDLVQMGEYKDRQPSKLSGGQQQRIALARAIVINPDILLMDEPLSNLDAKLRISMREVIKKIQINLNITTVYVTHDQEEALAISDRIAVMNGGKIQQIGSPKEIYQNPGNTFVADFIGTSTFIDCTLESKTGKSSLLKIPDGGEVEITLQSEYSGGAILAFRAEEVTLGESRPNMLNGKIVFSTFLGGAMNYEIMLGNDQVVLVTEYLKDNEVWRTSGDEVSLDLNLSRINLFDIETREVLV